MKKLELTAVANFLRTLPADTTFPNPAYNGESHIIPEFSVQEILEMMDKELNRGTEQKAAKMSEYASAHDAVMGVLADATKPVTVAEIYESCQADLPEGFSKNKIAYALRTYWTDEVVKTEGKVNMYTKA